MKINIGCGKAPIQGWVNTDITGGYADLVFDCQDPWPLEENSAETVRICHVLEHLPRPLDFFKEAWRVLVPNGSLLIQMPYGGHRSAWWDLTHLRPWYAENFAMLQPGYAEAVGNPQHDVWKTPYGVTSTAVRISRNVYELLQKRKYRKLMRTLLPYLTDVGEELFVFLFALKRDSDIRQYHMTQRVPNAVPLSWVIYQHHKEGRALLREGEVPVLVTILEQLGYTLYHGEVDKEA